MRIWVQQACTQIGELGLLRRFGELTQVCLLACLIVLLGFAYYAIIFTNPVQRIGSVLTVLGAGYLMYQLILSKSHIRPETALGNTADGLTFYRSELQRQSDFHRGIWFWSRLVIFVPGPVIFMIGFADAYPSLKRYIEVELAILVLLSFLAISLNLRKARKYQRELDALDSSTPGSSCWYRDDL